MVPLAGLEPALLAEADFESAASTIPPQRLAVQAGFLPHRAASCQSFRRAAAGIRLASLAARTGLDICPMSSQAAPADRTLLQTIEALADAAPEQGFSLREIFDHLDESAFGAVLFLLALPCCIPFLYGVPQVVAVPMIALAAQMALGRAEPWLPSGLAARKIDKKGLTQMASGGRKWLGWIEHLIRPRLSGITGKRSERVIGLFLVFFCASILVPLPMTNTVPGFAVAIAAFGLMQKDGLAVIAGIIVGTSWIGALIFGAATGIGLVADAALGS